MKVFQYDSNSMQHEVVADVPFSSAYIDREGIIEDESTYIPYNDNALCEAVQPCICEIASRNEWMFPDYDNVKIMIAVDTDGQQPRIQLMIEVEPPHYTEQDKTDILSHVSKEPILDWPSDCDNWCGIFDTAYAYHNGGTACGRDTMELYDMGLEPDEMQDILSIVELS